MPHSTHARGSAWPGQSTFELTSLRPNPRGAATRPPPCALQTPSGTQSSWESSFPRSRVPHRARVQTLPCGMVRPGSAGEVCSRVAAVIGSGELCISASCIARVQLWKPTELAHPAASRIGRGCLRTIARALEHPWNKTLSLWGDFQHLPGVEAIESTGFMERAMGNEPTSEAWEASILPLYDARSVSYASKPA